jgi:uncharacterized membrane protein YphA (DoxX/SURF4 family)
MSEPSRTNSKVKALSNVARILYGLAILGFATQYLIYATRHQGPIPGPPWTPGNVVFAYLLTLFLFVTGASLVANKMPRVSAGLLAVLFLVRFAFMHLPKVLSHLHDPGPWTSGFEILALAGGALVLASDQKPGFLTTVGSICVAALLVVVGVQHFMYAKFVSTLVPAWMPSRLFLAYLVGVGFFATAASLLTRVLTRFAAVLQGIVFAIFVVTLHIPRVVATPHGGNEWTSLFVAVAMTATSFALAVASPK